MNIKQLKILIKDLPDDIIIVVPEYDHSYRVGNAQITTAIKEGREYSEDIDESGETVLLII